MKWVNFVANRLFMQLCFFFLVIALIFISRQSLFGLPKDLEYIVLGIVLGGTFSAPALITCIPELLVYGRQAAKEGTIEQVDDMITSLFVVAMAIGEFLGPMLVS